MEKLIDPELFEELILMGEDFHSKLIGRTLGEAIIVLSITCYLGTKGDRSGYESMWKQIRRLYPELYEKIVVIE